MWWLFKKKSPIKEIKENLEKLNSTVKISFNNVRKDINYLKSKLNTQDSSITELNKIIQEIQQNQERNFKKELHLQEIETLKPDRINLINSLTNLQKSILIRLKILSHETDHKWISMKFLAQDLYPDKDYNLIKSMISSYTDTLLQLNLIKKKRKGREIRLALTEKAYNLLPKKTIKIKKNIKR